jgi:DNA-directed RNA polymerase beta' subunit
MEPKTSEISELKFGVYSPQEVLDISCCEITTSRNYGPNSIYDYKLGTIDEKNCDTCEQKAKDCPGHFGHIVLNEPILHPLYYREIVKFLRCVCTRCYKILISEDELRLHNIHIYKGQARFEKILDKLSKVDMCNDPDCGAPRPLVKHSPADDSISLVRINGDKSKTIIPQTPSEIIRILNGLSDDDVRLLGFDPTLMHPRNLIFINLLVMPTCCRPWVEKDKTTYDDDFSIQYMEIVKANDKLLDPKLKEIDRQKVINNIKFKISSTFNNKGGRATHNQNGRPIKSIKNRITGKDGQIRDNLSGKRVEQSGRTVIGPDPTLKLGELAMPREMAEILTVPERVTKFNYDKLQEMVDVPRVEGLYKGEYRVDSLMTPDGKTTINLKRYRRGKMLYPGDIILRDGQEILVETGREVLVEGDALTRNGEDVPNLKYSNRPYKLKMGWIVERKLQDGDMVLLNRQPTLHSGSMQAMKIIVRPYKTLRINLAITKGFNADFDGDEMDLC